VANADGTQTLTLNPPLVQPLNSGALAFSYVQTPPRPLRIVAGRRYIYQNATSGIGIGTSNEVPLVPMSRLDYAAMPDKSTTGTVTQYFYDPQDNPLGVVYCWPTPADDTAALKFTAQRPLQDINVLTNLVDFPQEWINTLTWNLAKELGPEYDVVGDRWAIIKEMAESSFQMASTWDRETGSVLFGVAYDPQYRTG
jgi:hypothetical protein